MTRCAATLLLIAASLAACTYGPPEDHVDVQNVALKPDGTQVAVAVKYERYGVATGLAAFPDGGVPRYLTQRAEFYVVDLPTRTLVYRGELPAPEVHRRAFSPWVMGWDGDTVYFKITGCPGDECYGQLVQMSFFMVPPGGRLTPTKGGYAKATLVSRIDRPSGYVSVERESYGVSTGTQLGAPTTPLMRVVGDHLELVPL